MERADDCEIHRASASVGAQSTLTAIIVRGSLRNTEGRNDER